MKVVAELPWECRTCEDGNGDHALMAVVISTKDMRDLHGETDSHERTQ